MRKPCVVDTNVLLVANGGSEYERGCVSTCGLRLASIKDTGCVVLDVRREILKEYQQKIMTRRQPGLGFVFWRWLVNTRSQHDHISYVDLKEHKERGYEQFPEHEGLVNFDPADRKFVAAALAHAEAPPILQATDSKWVGWNDALRESGVIVDFLCARQI